MPASYAPPPQGSTVSLSSCPKYLGGEAAGRGGSAPYPATARNRRLRSGGIASISTPVNTCKVFICRSTTA